MMTMYRVCPMTQHEWPAATQDLTVRLALARCCVATCRHTHVSPAPMFGSVLVGIESLR